MTLTSKVGTDAGRDRAKFNFKPTGIIIRNKTEISKYYSSFAISIHAKNRRTQRGTDPYYVHLEGLDVGRQI